jgi:hypothetical protein
MIDSAAYRRAEIAAGGPRDMWPNYEITDFPARVESLLDIAPHVNRLQEGRFDRFQLELGGLTEEDCDLIVTALVDYACMASLLFSTHAVSLPLDTAMAMLALYRKIDWRPCADVLEIGPGAGFLSFYLARHKGLRSYHQIEITESLYLLQSAVNDVAFGAGHYEQAADWRYGEMGDDEVKLNRFPHCSHWPWWLSDRIVPENNHFDLILFGANLCEMTKEALGDHQSGYMGLVRASLRSSGAVIIQCYGAESGASQDYVRNRLVASAGLDEVFYRPDHPPGPCGPDFITAAGVYANEPHAAICGRGLYRESTELRRMVTKEEIVEAVCERLPA